MDRKIMLSLGLAIAGYFLGIVADANHETGSALFVAACLTKILFFSIAVPLAYSAGKKIRRESNTTGMPALRFMGWTVFGVAMTHYLLFFQWPLIAAGNSVLPDGQITVDSAMFFIASMLMIADARDSHRTRE